MFAFAGKRHSCLTGKCHIKIYHHLLLPDCEDAPLPCTAEMQWQSPQLTLPHSEHLYQPETLVTTRQWYRLIPEHRVQHHRPLLRQCKLRPETWDMSHWWPWYWCPAHLRILTISVWECEMKYQQYQDNAHCDTWSDSTQVNVVA